MTRPAHAERDPLPPAPWHPTSAAWRRREALQQTAEAIRKAKDGRKKPATPARYTPTEGATDA